MLNKPSLRLAILRAQLAVEARAIEDQRDEYLLSARNPVTRLHDDYEADRLQFFADCEARTSASQRPLDVRDHGAQGAALIGVKQPAPGLRHMVCVSSPTGAPVGRVYDKHSHKSALAMIASNARLGLDYRLCDAEGFIPHTPTTDSVCPVPEGVEFEAKTRDGDTSPRNDFDDDGSEWRMGRPGHPSPHPFDIVAWRPIAKAPA